MKLYTEEQMHTVMLLALGMHGLYIDKKQNQDLIDLLTPIELPSDDEIENEAEDYTDKFVATALYAFEDGAKWMRDKIQGGDK